LPVGAETLEPYLRALLAENETLNLTGIRDVEQARVLHVLDSLAIAELGLAPRRCLDLGTGNGFPGVALRVLFPEAQVTLLDRTGKKLDAITRALATAGMTDITTVHVDAAVAPRTHPELTRQFDLITARAVGRPRLVARLAAPLATAAAHLVLWLDEQTAAPTEVTGFSLEQVLHYDLPEPAARRRRLAVYGTRRNP
jgi:16S rRNA (guanine527-N7)-methyltransferase